MNSRFDIRPECETTWTVYDSLTGQPVIVDGREMIGLDVQDADELAEKLNTSSQEKLLADA